MKTFDSWFDKEFKKKSLSWRLPRFPIVKLAWDYQQKQIDRLEAKVKLLTECVNGYARLRSNTGHRAKLTLEKLNAMEKEG